MFHNLYLHYLKCWNLHKISVTKFDSVGNKRRPGLRIFYLLENVWQGVKLPPPNRNRVKVLNVPGSFTGRKLRNFNLFSNVHESLYLRNCSFQATCKIYTCIIFQHLKPSESLYQQIFQNALYGRRGKQKAPPVKGSEND